MNGQYPVTSEKQLILYYPDGLFVCLSVCVISSAKYQFFGHRSFSCLNSHAPNPQIHPVPYTYTHTADTQERHPDTQTHTSLEVVVHNGDYTNICFSFIVQNTQRLVTYGRHFSVTLPTTFPFVVLEMIKHVLTLSLVFRSNR